MNAANQHQLADDASKIILDAAFKRFIHFGYHKTTMAEIADDAGMSAANLYRYFENKQELVAQCAARCLDDRLERLRRFVSDPDTLPEEKLRQYALELVNDSHALAGTESRIGEMVDNITRERPALLHSKNEIHYGFITEILDAGVARGDFAISNVDACARLIHSAFMMFDVPLFVGLYERAEFDRRALGVADLIIAGLRAK
jgi:AcrR family transcriptional regulator